MLEQVKVDVKINEITAIPELLKMLNILCMFAVPWLPLCLCVPLLESHHLVLSI
jgi:hypothetical protein